MTLEIIIIALCTIAALLAAILAAHNIRELQDTRIRRDEAEERNYSLELENERLERHIDELKLELNAEQKNSKDLRRIIIDYEIAANKQQEEPEPAAVEEILQANAKERLPEGVATNRYDCEGYKFPAGTQQAMLQRECFTSPSTGLRTYISNHVYYCVAMGGAYGIDIGDAWRVTLRNENEFYIILSDYQHDISDPDPDDFGERYEYDSAGNVVGLLRNYDGEICVHVLEFIADIGRLPPEAKEAGGMHGVEFFGGIHGDGGNIVKLKYLGRKWEP